MLMTLDTVFFVVGVVVAAMLLFIYFPFLLKLFQNGSESVPIPK